MGTGRFVRVADAAQLQRREQLALNSVLRALTLGGCFVASIGVAQENTVLKCCRRERVSRRLSISRVPGHLPFQLAYSERGNANAYPDRLQDVLGDRYRIERELGLVAWLPCISPQT